MKHRRTQSRMSVLRRLAVVLGLGACALAAEAADPLKIGFVYVGPVGDHGWTYQHELGRRELVEHFGDKVKTSFVENVAEAPTPSGSSATWRKTATAWSSPPPSAT